MKLKIKRLNPILIIFLLSFCVSFRSISIEGYSSVISEDAYIYTSWASFFNESLRQGILYPRWMELDFYGYGSPVFILYSPLFYYLISLLNVFSESILNSMNILKSGSLFATGVGIYLLVSELHSRRIGLITSCFYIILPFNSFIYYYYGTYSSVCALMFIPFIILFVFRYFEHGSNNNIYLSGLIFGLLLIGHLITAYMFFFVLLLFVIMLVIAYKKSITRHYFFAIIPAFGISSPYLIPLILEQNHFNIRNFIESEPVFKYWNYFSDINNSDSPNRFFNAYGHTFYSFFNLFLIMLILSFTLSLIDKYIYEKQLPLIQIPIIGSAVFTIFVQTSLSSRLWQNIPYFDLIQFPFRWMAITSIMACIASSYIFDFVLKFNKLKAFAYITLLSLFVLFVSIDYSIISNSHIFNSSMLLPPRGVNRAVEHLPKEVDLDFIKKNKFTNPLVSSLHKSTSTELVTSKPELKIWRINAKTDDILRFNIFYFPGWNAYIDDLPTDIIKEQKTTAIMVRIPSGEHIVKLNLEDTLARLIGKVTFVAFLITAIIYTLIYMKTARATVKFRKGS